MSSFSSQLEAFDFKTCQLLGGSVNPGRVVYVSSVTGSSTASGRQIRTPISTIDAAIGKCTAGKGDVIVVLPGHTEAITAAGGITCDVAGVSIIGLGNGRNRPKLTWTTANTATLAVSAANVTIKNIAMDMTGVDAVASGIAVTAADFTLDSCEIELANASGQAVLGILTTAAADRLKITNNHFFGSTDAGTATAIRIVGGNDHVIKGNFINGSYTNSLGGIENNTTACLRILIEGNTIVNRTASSTKAIVLDSSTTGVCRNNVLGILSGTAPITGAALDAVGMNYYKAAAGVAAGTLL